MIEHEGKIWIQKSGVCIGACLAPILSEIYLSYVDRTIQVKLKNTSPECTVDRYVDDNLIIHPVANKVEVIVASFKSAHQSKDSQHTIHS